ncbi:hypothetical protein OG289_21685 [Streptomyces sp. NBC_01235]|nr:hypothetical protein OG289_21685 [Streptomyces sp. NBC_01235]
MSPATSKMAPESGCSSTVIQGTAATAAGWSTATNRRIRPVPYWSMKLHHSETSISWSSVEPVKVELVDEFDHIARQAGDAVSVVRFAGQSVAARIQYDDPAGRGQAAELVPEHLLCLPPSRGA